MVSKLEAKVIGMSMVKNHKNLEKHRAAQNTVKIF